MRPFILIILVLAATWLASDYSANHTNQFRAQNQFFINDFNRIQRDGGIMYIPPGHYIWDDNGIRRLERNVLDPIRLYPDYEVDY